LSCERRIRGCFFPEFHESELLLFTVRDGSREFRRLGKAPEAVLSRGEHRRQVVADLQFVTDESLSGRLLSTIFGAD